MTKIKGLPVFKAVLDEKGMVRVSLVTSPAVNKDFIAYEEQQAPITYAVEDEDKRLVYGVVMRANYPIYREMDGKSFFITHSPELIREMAEKYFINGYQNNVDTQHNGVDEEGCNLIQFFIKDTDKGVNPVGFEEVENGSLFGEWHITNDEVWEKVKSGEFKGFSIEVYEGLEEAEGVVSEEKVDAEVLEWLSRCKKKKQLSKDDMAIMEKIKAALVAGVAETEEAAEKFGSVSTDNGILHWEGDEDLKIEDAVSIVGENDEKSAAPDGEYKTEDGHVIVVEGGQVKAINNPEKEGAEEKEEEGAEGEQKMSRIDHLKAVYGSSFNERIEAIYKALKSLGIDCYIYDAGDDFAIVEIWDGANYAYYRYQLSFDENDTVTIGTRVEVKRAFVPVESNSNSGEDFTSAIAEAIKPLNEEISSLKEAVKSFGKQSMAKDTHIEYKKAVESKKGFEAEMGLEYAMKATRR